MLHNWDLFFEGEIFMWSIFDTVILPKKFMFLFQTLPTQSKKTSI